jgi:hypothetical protein
MMVTTTSKENIMNRTVTRFASFLAAPAIGAGILIAGLSVAGPAQAQGPAQNGGQTQSCTTSTGVGGRNGASAGLTRAGQLAASAPSAPEAPTSCVGH